MASKMSLLEFNKGPIEAPGSARPAKTLLPFRRNAYFAKASKCYKEALRSVPETLQREPQASQAKPRGAK